MNVKRSKNTRSKSWATAMLILVNVLGGTLRIDSQLLIMD